MGWGVTDIMAKVYKATQDLLDGLKTPFCVICDREVALNDVVSFTKNWQICHANCYRNALAQSESAKYIEK